MLRTLILVAFLVGCVDAPEHARLKPTLAARGHTTAVIELIASIKTSKTSDTFLRKRLCLDAGRYRLEARAPDGEPLTTATVYRDDGSEDGKYVKLVMRNRNQQRTVREPFTIDEDGHCYWLSIHSGIRGHTTEARLYLVIKKFL